MSINRREALVGLGLTTAASLAMAPTTNAAPPQLIQGQPAPRTVEPLGPDFLWGTASSGFQAEGNAPDSNWSRYVAAGKTAEPYGDSIDFAHRFADDIALAAQLGIGVYRTGIEWARVQPRRGEWNDADWQLYDQVVAAVTAAGMRPMLTLDHWVYPGWVADRGGWADPETSEHWLAYARRATERYAPANPLWITFNEPTFYLFNEVRMGGIAAAETPVMIEQLISAHIRIYDHIHRVQPHALVSSNTAYLPTVEDPVNGQFVNRVASHLDFIGIDYYYGLSPTDRDLDLQRPWRNAQQTEGIYYALRHYAKTFPDKPLYIIENGLPTEDGKPRADGYTRADHLRDSVYWVQRARHDAMNVIGYTYWSLTDNYEWGSYAPRFGLYTVDVHTDQTLARTPTDGVAAYTAIVRDGGVPSDYRPTRPPQDCSLVDGLASCADAVRLPE